MRSLNMILVLAVLVSVIGFVSHGPAQEGESEKNVKSDVPAAALLTERGRALANELRNLERTKANLGERHPTMQTIKNRIIDVKQQLQAWAPAAEPNPFKGEGAAEKPNMNEMDLQQMILNLSAKVAALEKRVAVLEGKR